MSASRKAAMLKFSRAGMLMRKSGRDPDGRASVELRLAWRACLEAFVQPVILFRHVAGVFLDESIHAPGVVLHARAGKILPRRIKAGDVAPRARQLTRDARNNAGAGHACHARH